MYFLKTNILFSCIISTYTKQGVYWMQDDVLQFVSDLRTPVSSTNKTDSHDRTEIC